MVEKIGINISPNYLLAINHITAHLEEIISEVKQQSHNTSTAYQLNVVKKKVKLLHDSIIEVHRQTIDAESSSYNESYLPEQTKESNLTLIEKLNEVTANDIGSIDRLPHYLQQFIKTPKSRKR